MQSQRQSPKPSSQKKTLTLEAWESKSPLSDLGKDAIASISQTRMDRSFPTIVNLSIHYIIFVHLLILKILVRI